MSDRAQQFSNLGFVKTYVVPALLVFFLPVVSLLFFLHAQNTLNAEAKKTILEQIQKDATFTPEGRAEATEFYSRVPFSELVKHPEFAANLSRTSRFHWFTIRWMIRLSAISIVAGIAVFPLAGICVLLSLRSLRAQYLSLAVGWQVLRIYSAIQILVQVTMLVALSYWVTALWMEVYYVKLIGVCGIMALVAVAVIAKAIFTSPPQNLVESGHVIGREAEMPIWPALRAICSRVDTDPPDQVIVGIDDNFFVTEVPVVVDDKEYAGRTLYVSLSLLKHMNGAEADAVLAHEMAHFHGRDTFYSRKISPLMARYNAYLIALQEGGITWPVFQFMLCFRALFALSLARLSREREFRADALAAQATSPHDLAGGLLRCASYSKFRADIQNQLFHQDRALETANVSEQLDAGYVAYATQFASSANLGELTLSHPFDSHPPIGQRLAALGMQLESPATAKLLAGAGDGRWYSTIDHVEEIERTQWSEFEERFREVHESTLPYRVLPETDEERAIVEKAFPPRTIEGKKGNLVLDFEGLMYTGWADPVLFREIGVCSLNGQTLQVYFTRERKQYRSIPTKTFGRRQNEAIDAIGRYYGRYKNAVDYLNEKPAENQPSVEPQD